LLGRYAADAPALVSSAQQGELEVIAGTQTLWAELRWAARSEGVIHLDDLLLRRVRLGHLLSEGGKALMPEIRAICQPELAWDDARWEAEEAAYLDLWQTYYGLPDRADIPDWKDMLVEARTKRELARPTRRRKIVKGSAWAGLLGALVLLLVLLYCWRRKAVGKRREL
jgi:glycerol-3-phosphate dehydrogenase